MDEDLGCRDRVVSWWEHVGGSQVIGSVLWGQVLEFEDRREGERWSLRCTVLGGTFPLACRELEKQLSHSFLSHFVTLKK